MRGACCGSAKVEAPAGNGGSWGPIWLGSTSRKSLSFRGGLGPALFPKAYRSTEVAAPGSSADKATLPDASHAAVQSGCFDFPRQVQPAVGPTIARLRLRRVLAPRRSPEARQ